jgi:uncharacterized protein (DUF1330 family)
MRAYLVLDLSVNDFGDFKKYVAEIPAFIARHSGKYIVQGVRPTPIEGDWKPDRMVIIEFQNARMLKHSWVILKFRACSRCATARQRVDWCWSMAARSPLPRRLLSVGPKSA